MDEARIKGLIGLSRRAGQLSLGTDTVLKQLKARACGVVLVDETAAENTLKRVGQAAEAADVPVYSLPEALLDAATGQSGRIVACVRRGSLADQLNLSFKSAEKA